MKNLLISVFLVIFFYQGFGQLNKPEVQMPNVAALNKFIDFPVDKKTGTPQVSVPLYSITIGDFTLPISVAYHANGIRVEDRASNVGLGWALVAEPTLSRTVKGLPDESVGGYYSHGGPYSFVDPYVSPPLHQAGGGYVPGQIIPQMEGWQDTQPDLFYFNLGNYSGKFVFDTGKVVRLIPEQDIKIEVLATNNIEGSFSFKITTPDGTQFVFRNNKDYCQTYGHGGDDAQVKIAWHADSIITIKNQFIAFEYQEDGSIANRMIQHESMLTHGLNTCPYINAAEWRQTIRGYAIRKIKTASAEVEFNYKSTTREDIRPNDAYFIYAIAKALDNIQIKNRLDGLLIQKYQFFSSYFVANDTSVIANDTYLKKRLRLDEIKQIGENSDTLSLYKFSYNKYNHTYQNKLPSRVSTAQDHWGFFNGKTANSNLYPTFTFYNNLGTDSVVCLGANREPDTAYIKAYILDEIIYPTGGIRKFFYEAIPSPYDSSATVGGLRIKQTLDEPLTGQPLKISYSYEETSLVGGLPVYQQFLEPDDFDYLHFPEACPMWSGGQFWRKYFVFTNPVNYTGELSSNYVLFGKVTQTTEGSGSVESFYDVESLYGEQDLVDVNIYPFTVTQPLLKSGQLIKETYKTESGEKIKEQEYTYLSYGRSTNISAYIPYNPFCYPLTKQISISTGAAYLVEEIQTDYINESTQISKKRSHEYSGIPSLYDIVVNGALVKHHFVTKTTEYLNDTIIMLMKYPKDYLSTGFVGKLRESNIVNIPIERLKLRKRGDSLYIVSASLTAFYSTKPLVSKYFVLEQRIPLNLAGFSESSSNSSGVFNFSSAYQEQIEAKRYDAVGNICEIKGTNGLSTAYIWESKFGFISCQVTNADSGSIAHSSFESENKGNWSYSGSVSTDASAPTGNKCYSLTTTNTISKTGLSSGNTYVISYWRKNGGSLSVNGSASPTRIGKTVDGWTHYEHEIAGVTSVTISGTAYIDEVRLYPKGAMMTSYTYKPLIGVSSECDLNNRITYYDYDGFGRLRKIKDQDKNIIKVMDYQYQKSIQQ